MKVRKAWIKSKEPAALDHLAELQEDIHLDLNQLETRLSSKMEEQTEKILYEFKAITENIHKDVSSANKDEISWIKDKIRAIQRHLGFF
ncbi:MAG: hypothetical protein AAB538_03025 [Patescibacteria group bacterium]